MSDVKIDISVGGDVSGGRVIKRSLDDVADSGNKAKQSTDKLETAFEKMQSRAGSAERRLKDLALAGKQNTERFKRLKSQTDAYKVSLKQAENAAISKKRSLDLLKSALISVGAAFGIREVLRLADSYQILQARIEGITRLTGDYVSVSEDLFSISQRIGSSLESNVALFQRVNIGAQELGRSNSEVLALVQTVNQLGVIGGASTEAMRAGTMQFSQAMAGGILRAEEFNSIMENIPELGVAIGEGLGVSVGQLRQMVLDGQVLAQDVFSALESQSDEIAQRFEDMPINMGRATTMLGNAVQKLLGDFDRSAGITSGFASSIALLSENLGHVVKVIGVLIGASIPLMIKAFAAALPAAIAATTTAIVALTAAITANPLGAIAVGVSAAISALFLFREEIMEVLDSVNIFGVSAAEVFFTIKNTAIEVFSGLFDIIMAPIISIYQEFETTVAKLLMLANKIPGVNIPLSEGIIAASQRTRAEIWNENFGSAFDGANGVFSRIRQSTINDLDGLRNPVQVISNQGGSGSGSGGDNDPLGKLNNALDTANTKSEDLANTVNREVSPAFENLASEIDDGFKDAFKDAFTESDGGFKRMLEGWKATFQNFLADLAYQATLRPIVLSVVSGVGGAMSVSNTAIAQTLGGGVGGGFSPLSIGRLLGGQGAGNIFSGALTGINNFGSQLGLGFAAPIGPNLPGAVSLTGSLGFGGLGSLAAGLFGLGSGNFLIDGGLGALGGVAGGAVGSSIGGSLLGLGLGPLGAVAGGFLGTALGGLFGGGSTPSRAIQATYELVDGRLKETGRGSDEASSEQFEAFDELGQNLANTVAGVEQALGLTLKSLPAFVFGSTRREPGIFKSTVTETQHFGDFNSALDFGLNTAFEYAVFQDASDKLSEIINGIFTKGGKFEERVQEAIEAKNIYDFIYSGTEEELPPLTQALNNLNEQFDLMRDKVKELGLPVEKLNEAYEQQKTAIVDGALRPLQDFLDQQALSGQSSLNPLDRLSLARSAFDDNLSAIQQGNYSDLGLITNQASQLLNIGRDVFASGQGFASLEAYVRESIAGIGTTLGAPGALDADMNREIVLSNERQTSLLQQLNAQVGELKEENRRLRKEMERVGNALVVQR